MKDLVKSILVHISIKQVLKYNLVCKDWYKILQDDDFWKTMLILQHPEMGLIHRKSKIKWKNWIQRRWKNYKYVPAVFIGFMTLAEMRSFLITTTIVRKMNKVDPNSKFGTLSIISLTGRECVFGFLLESKENHHLLSLEMDTMELILDKNGSIWKNIKEFFKVLYFPRKFCTTFAYQLESILEHF